MCRKDRQIKELKQIIKKLQKIIVRQAEEIADLKRRLDLNSSNSSKPPSSDGLKKPPRVCSLREKSGKKSGGQPGHKGSTLRQVENPDLIEQYEINCCPYCEIDLTSEPIVDICKKQVFDIPKIKPFITEHQFQIKCCPKCKKRVKIRDNSLAKAPVQYGPNVKATVSYLNMYNLIPEKRTAEIMGDVFSMPMSDATVENISKTCTANVVSTVEQIKECLKKASIKGADETGIRINGKSSWVHILANNRHVHYRPSEKRGDIEKNLKGTVVHDCFAPYYNELENVQHALCNAHILRELKAVTEIDKEPWAENMTRILLFGQKLVQQRPQDITTQLLIRIKKLYDQTINKALSYHENLGVLKKSKRGRVKRRPGHNLALRLQKYSDDVLRFLIDSEVPFTNNQAERSLRMIKVQQKVSGCFRTFEGAEKFLTIRSYVATAQKQGYNILDALTSVFQKNPLLLV